MASSLPSKETQCFPSDGASYRLSGLDIQNHLIYETTRLHHEEIRLVRLLPGSWTDTIRCTIQRASLAAKPRYKALSYTWGSLKVGRPIVVNGHRHLVTCNLEAALRQLRSDKDSLVLWIDAVSINQADVQERTSQVQLIRIFSSAEEVVIYLGDDQDSPSVRRARKRSLSPITALPNDNKNDATLAHYKPRSMTPSGPKSKSDYAFDVLGLIRHLSANEHINSFPPLSDASSLHANDGYRQDLFETLRMLLCSKWWNRTWVIQEAVVGRKLLVVYDSLVAPWEMLVAAAEFLSLDTTAPTWTSLPSCYQKVLSYFSRKVLDIQRMREAWKDNQKTSLLELLRQFSGRLATDPRDKIYALLELAKDVPQIKPDYSLSVPQVFINATLDMIRRTGNLEVLLGDPSRKSRSDLPSWVPDWSATLDVYEQRRANVVSSYSASLESTVHLAGLKMDWDGVFCACEHGDGVLHIPGLCVDSIRETGPVFLDPSDLTQVIYEWATLASESSPDYQYRESRSESLLEAFWRTLCADTAYLDAPGSASRVKVQRIDSHLWCALKSWMLQDPSSPFFAKGTTKDKLPTNFRGAEFYREDKGGVVFDEDLWPLDQVIGISYAVQSAVTRRSFFVTDGGFIGLGPANIRPADDLYILPGGKTPFIMRETTLCHGPKEMCCESGLSQNVSGSRQAMEMIGDCYAHGLMDGKAMRSWRERLWDEMVEQWKTWQEAIGALILGNIRPLREHVEEYNKWKSESRQFLSSKDCWKDQDLVWFGWVAAQKEWFARAKACDMLAAGLDLIHRTAEWGELDLGIDLVSGFWGLGLDFGQKPVVNLETLDKKLNACLLSLSGLQLRKSRLSKQEELELGWCCPYNIDVI